MESVKDCVTCMYGNLPAAELPCAACWPQNNWRYYKSTLPETISTEELQGGAKYDNGKPQLSLVCFEFAVILLREHKDRAAVNAYLAVKKLSMPDTCTESKFNDALFYAIDCLGRIAGPRALLEECAVAMGPNGGCKKYRRNNWRLGLGAQRLLDAAERHLIAYLDGEETDAETTAKHFGNAAFCLQCIAAYWREPGRPHMQALFESAKKENWSCKK